jgi:hypothetical protein
MRDFNNEQVVKKSFSAFFSAHFHIRKYGFLSLGQLIINPRLEEADRHSFLPYRRCEASRSSRNQS